ncbi:FUSC family protein [Microbacterium sp. B19]|uniref:FUSC family protein n=1 Tax=Microbacterium sp. B19 TaxID=96765 RepID=UPI00034D3557|nr:FUSC family protein [Microbacterium sp. B19]
MRDGWRARLGRGALALIAVAIVVAILLVVLPEPAAVMLGIALTASLSRSQLERDARGRLESLVLLPVVGVVGEALGALLRVSPLAGAAVYVIVLVGVVLLRDRGPAWRRAGSLAATTFLAVLFLPGGAGGGRGPLVAVVAPILIAVLAWVVVTVVQTVARVVGFLPRDVAPAPATPPRRETARPSAAVRAAVQLAAALVPAFLVGGLVFGAHGAWVVLSTVIVAYLPRGRADAIRTGLHRLVGAAAGSLVALLPAAALPGNDTVLVIGALAAVGFGILFRDVGYVAWAFGVTVALTLLERLTGAATPLIGQRLVEIALGVAIGLAAVASVYPVPTTDVVRLRLAAVLAAVSDRLAATDASTARVSEAQLRSALRELDRSAAALVEAGRALALVRRPPPPAVTWCRDAHAIAATAVSGPTPGPPALRRAVGDARRVLRTPAELGPALRRAADPA